MGRHIEEKSLEEIKGWSKARRPISGGLACRELGVSTETPTGVRRGPTRVDRVCTRGLGCGTTSSDLVNDL